MLFNTLQFAVFFVVVYALYLSMAHKRQNRMLLVASYVFYGAWDAVFLTLIVISTCLDFMCGIQIYEAKSELRKKAFLSLSIGGNLALLCYFKYFNFFVESLQGLFSVFGVNIHMTVLDIILPVGISFYTFQTMSYTIDIYRRKAEPTRQIFDFALYVAFFPQLVAGPIERATRLLPQVLKPRRVLFEDVRLGGYLIFWGLFQKIFVADNLARIVDPVFASQGPYNGMVVMLASYAFSIQIYCDFAGYSNIARGLARCMGFDIILNFNLPYFATNPREFWRRWHISLSTWLRDYLFRPLGGYTRNSLRASWNVIVVFFLGGLWHGANWTFILWGLYNAFLLISYTLLGPILKQLPVPRKRFLSGVHFIIRVVFFFHLFCFGIIIFRSQSFAQLYEMIHGLFFQFVWPSADIARMVYQFVFYTWLLLSLEVVQYMKNDLDVVLRWPVWGRGISYFVCLYLMLIFGVQGGEQFYYFQF